jgi:hypothetical protein
VCVCYYRIACSCNKEPTGLTLTGHSAGRRHARETTKEMCRRPLAKGLNSLQTLGHDIAYIYVERVKVLKEERGMKSMFPRGRFMANRNR